MQFSRPITPIPGLSPPIIPKHELENKKLLGEGSYGQVFTATWSQTEVAVKRVEDVNLAEYVKDINDIFACTHPAIVALHGVCNDKGHKALIFEFMPGGSLHHLLQNKKHDISWDISWNTRRALAIQIGGGLNYLHSQDMLHKGIKSSNILLTGELHAKIGDFGLSRIKAKIAMDNQLCQARVKVNWRPKESFARFYKWTMAADVYSYGMVLWEMASREIPFATAANQKEVIGLLMEGKQETIPEDCPTDFKQVIKDAWLNVQDRPGIEKLVSQLVDKKPPVSALPPSSPSQGK